MKSTCSRGTADCPEREVRGMERRSGWRSMKRGLSFLLVLALIFTSVDLTPFKVNAESGAKPDAEPVEEAVRTITSFAALDEAISAQEVTVGGNESGILFPDSLTVTLISEENGMLSDEAEADAEGLSEEGEPEEAATDVEEDADVKSAADETGGNNEADSVTDSAIDADAVIEVGGGIRQRD